MEPTKISLTVRLELHRNQKLIEKGLASGVQSKSQKCSKFLYYVVNI